MKVVATGGAGFIGSHLVDALVERGDEVIVVDDLSSGARQHLNPDVEFHQLDIRSRQAAELIRRRRPDAIAHHAAQMSVSRSVREPLFDADTNLIGSLNLLEAAREVGARFVFASTGGALYGDADVLPTPESYPAWPVSSYGVSKLGFEHYLHCYAAQHGLRYAALRYANVYGPRQNPHGEAGVIAIFCLRLLAEEEPIVNGDGKQTRDFVYVSDVVRAQTAALDSGVTGHFNVGTARQCDVNTVFDMIAERIGTSLGKRHGPARPGDQRTSALDWTLIRDSLGWQPQVSLEEGLSETVAWFRRAQEEP
ncbi:NAD-dependent epimerase/dehydratase family protein [Candidatus Nephthysia bennettiae]|uniref:GDP-mannose 4,6-dehydratase n=1 Tax=Candidatus Nephthysia bennettiae TaxID=3127016 RepID=A0A934K4G9_9BACT|nr:GDP-mannose 4,6-dehydratase [Candidatus Dormibacteraeota bacterium]MBJ7615071.1 GDP-mannose 4,6-dehydratase [Candidatus Dormibacteraeota bacterium]